jgi:hypothetical protein
MKRRIHETTPALILDRNDHSTELMLGRELTNDCGVCFTCHCSFLLELCFFSSPPDDVVLDGEEAMIEWFLDHVSFSVNLMNRGFLGFYGSVPFDDGLCALHCVLANQGLSETSFDSKFLSFARLPTQYEHLDEITKESYLIEFEAIGANSTEFQQEVTRLQRTTAAEVPSRRNLDTECLLALQVKGFPKPPNTVVWLETDRRHHYLLCGSFDSPATGSILSLRQISRTFRRFERSVILFTQHGDPSHSNHFDVGPEACETDRETIADALYECGRTILIQKVCVCVCVCVCDSFFFLLSFVLSSCTLFPLFR